MSWCSPGVEASRRIAVAVPDSFVVAVRLEPPKEKRIDLPLTSLEVGAVNVAVTWMVSPNVPEVGPETVRLVAWGSAGAVNPWIV
jgi:hypothetical protein